VRITDFGIAKALGRLTHTGAGTLKGKLAYASPEQMLCLPLDHRSDLFSLGVVVHETLTGRQLYGNTSDDDGSRRLIHDAPPDVGEERPDTPPELAELLFRMLAKDRERRPASADEVHQELEVLLSDLVSREGPLDLQAFVSDVAKDVREGRKQQVDSAVALATEVHATEVRAKRARRLRTGAVALGIAAVLGGAGGLALTFGADSEEPRPIEAPQIALPSVTPAPPAEATPEPRPPEPAVAEPAERPRARARRREATSNERRTLGRWGFDDR
jgi:serine/threonine-protein kinase